MEEITVAAFDMGTVNFAGALIRITRMPDDFETEIVKLYDKLDGENNPPPQEVQFDWLKIESIFALNLKQNKFDIYKSERVKAIEREYIEMRNRQPKKYNDIIDCTKGDDPLASDPKKVKFVPRLPFLKSLREEGKTENERVVDNLSAIFESDQFLFLSLMDYYITVENQVDHLESKNKSKRRRPPIMWALSLILRALFNPIRSETMKPHTVSFTASKYGLEECVKEFVPEMDTLDEDTQYDLRKEWSKKIGIALCWASKQDQDLMRVLYKVNLPDMLDALNMGIDFVIRHFKKPTKKQLETGDFSEMDEMDLEYTGPQENEPKKRKSVKRKRKIDAYLTTTPRGEINQQENEGCEEPPKKKQKTSPPPTKQPIVKAPATVNATPQSSSPAQFDPEEEGKKIYSKKKKTPKKDPVPMNTIDNNTIHSAPKKGPPAQKSSKPTAVAPATNKSNQPKKVSIPKAYKPKSQQYKKHDEFDIGVEANPYSDYLSGFDKDDINDDDDEFKSYSKSKKVQSSSAESKGRQTTVLQFDSFNDIVSFANDEYTF